jgi:hypothetical protein
MSKKAKIVIACLGGAFSLLNGAVIATFICFGVAYWIWKRG